MDRGAWWAIVNGVAELDMIELLNSNQSLFGLQASRQEQSGIKEDPR